MYPPHPRTLTTKRASYFSISSSAPIFWGTKNIVAVRGHFLSCSAVLWRTSSSWFVKPTHSEGVVETRTKPIHFLRRFVDAMLNSLVFFKSATITQKAQFFFALAYHARTAIISKYFRCPEILLRNFFCVAALEVSSNSGPPRVDTCL